MNNLAIEIKNQIATLTIMRASKLNALNVETLQEILQAVQVLNENKDVKGVLLTGEGEKAFVAGADISQMVNMTENDALSYSQLGHKAFASIENAPKPYIALINGFALGGGLELAMACHIRLAVEKSKLGLPEVTLGVIPGFGGTQRLTSLVGKAKAFEMVLTGDMITGQEAKELGLVNHIFPTIAEMTAKGNEILEKVSKRGSLAIEKAIKTINAQYDSEQGGYIQEVMSFGHLFATKDCKEGMNAFLEKRTPNFVGE
ncbi:MAG: enoyl-CoA hydratase [Bacteroidetes bacterium]|nr:MAG: enoyl-CoA hydratase [Bacteroidota bacterium]